MSDDSSASPVLFPSQEYDASGEKNLADKYEYVMHGKVMTR